jgi:uncharacterized membrane protein
MSPEPLHSWLLAGHIISVILWIGGLFAIYWMLRLHVHAPADVHEKLTLMERSIALSTDIAVTGVIASGVAMIVTATPNLLVQPGHGWLHIKLAVVVLGLLPVHGILRGKIKKFGQGKITPIPGWLWSMVLASVTVIVILAIRGPFMFAPKPETVPTTTAPTTK